MKVYQKIKRISGVFHNNLTIRLSLFSIVIIYQKGVPKNENFFLSLTTDDIALLGLEIVTPSTFYKCDKQDLE